MDTFNLIVTAWSNRDLESAKFERQVEMIKTVMSWDQGAWAWRNRLSNSRAEHATDVIHKALPTNASPA